MAPVISTTKEQTMDQFGLAIGIMAAVDRRWGSHDADGRRRAFTPEELNAFVDFGWHWPDLKGAMATCASAYHRSTPE